MSMSMSMSEFNRQCDQTGSVRVTECRLALKTKCAESREKWSAVRGASASASENGYMRNRMSATRSTRNVNLQYSVTYTYSTVVLYSTIRIVGMATARAAGQRREGRAEGSRAELSGAAARRSNWCTSATERERMLRRERSP